MTLPDFIVDVPPSQSNYVRVVANWFDGGREDGLSPQQAHIALCCGNRDCNRMFDYRCVLTAGAQCWTDHRVPDGKYCCAAYSTCVPPGP